MENPTRLKLAQNKKSGKKGKEFWIHKAGFLRKPEGIVLPSKHPAADLKRGEFKIKDGIIYEYLPDGRRKTPLVAGVPEEDQPGTIAGPFHLTKGGDLNELLEQRLELAAWSAEYSGKYLPKKAKESLKNLYSGIAKEVHKLDLSVAAEKLEEKKALEKRASIIQRSVSQERSIFGAHRRAQQHRYGRPIRKDSPSHSTTTIPSEAVIDFISGKYLKARPEPGKNPLTVKIRSISEFGNDVGKWKEIFELFRWLEHFKPKEPVAIEVADNYYLLELDDPPYPLGGKPIEDVCETGPWQIVDEEELSVTTEVRKFITKSPLTGDFIDLIDEYIDNIVHTNLVAGIWKGKQRQITEQREVRSSEVIFYEHRLYIEFVWDYEWIIANGNAWSYDEDDDVEMYYCGVFEDEESARRYLLSVQPYDDGNYYANQAAAYSVGQYGSNWVCHQNCNAFAYRKWGEAPFYHPVSWLIWGIYGTGHLCSGFQAISPARNIFGEEFPGGTPGPTCLNYHKFPCGSGQLQCDIMHGTGWGLEEDPWTDLGNGQQLVNNALCDNEDRPPVFPQLQRWASLNPFRIVANRWWTVT